MATEVRTKLTITADNTALVKALKEAQNEAAKLNDTAKQFSVGEAADRAHQAIRERAAVQQELVRRGVIEDPKRAEAERRQRQDALDRQRVAETRQQSMQTLAMQGLSLSGMGGAVGGFGQGQAIGGALEGMGFAGAARFAGPVGLAVGAAAMNAEMLKRQERFNPTSLYADPYMDPMTRARGNFSAMPFGETILSYSDTFSGRTAGMQRNEEARQRMGITLGHQTRMDEATMGAERRMAAGSAEREARSQFPFAMPQAFDRSTATGERQQREANAMIEPRKQAVRAEQELLKATRDREYLERNSVKISEERRNVGKEIVGQKKLENDLLELQQKAWARSGRPSTAMGAIAQLTGEILSPVYGYASSARRAGIGEEDYSVGINASRGSQAELGKRELDLVKQQQQNAKDLTEARQRENAAKLALGMSKVDILRSESGVLQGRESLASGMAQSIGGMGPGGRAEGLAARSALNDIGIENAPPSLIAAAEAVDPLGVAKLKEAAGKKLLGGEYGDQLRALGGGESIRDVAGLDKLREEVDKKRTETTIAENEASKNFGANAAEAATQLKDFLKFAAEELPILLQNAKNELILLRNGIGG